MTVMYTNNIVLTSFTKVDIKTRPSLDSASIVRGDANMGFLSTVHHCRQVETVIRYKILFFFTCFAY